MVLEQEQRDITRALNNIDAPQCHIVNRVDWACKR
jgi:hypothetical protein